MEREENISIVCVFFFYKMTMGNLISLLIHTFINLFVRLEIKFLHTRSGEQEEQRKAKKKRASKGKHN